MGRVGGQSERSVRWALALALLAVVLLTPPGHVAGRPSVTAQGGVLSAWGANYAGQLGDGTTMIRDEPVRVTNTGPDDLAFVAIDAGTSHSVGLTANGTAYAWGDNEHNQLGTGAPNSSTTPRVVAGTGPGGIALVAVAAGDFFTLALTANGTAYGWGDNRQGQLGNNTSGGSSSSLVQVSGTGPGGIVLTAIAAGTSHGLALTANGTAYAWGYNEYGQLGKGDSGPGTGSTTPVQVSGTGPSGIAFTAITAGAYFSLALAANGTGYGWGDNTLGQVGNGASGTGVVQTTPAAVSGTGPGGVALTAVAAGASHSLGLVANGTAYGWGWNQYGQLGKGDSGSGTSSPTPVQVTGTGPGGAVLTAIAAGAYFSLGLAANGTAYGWGDNQSGQVGNGTSGTGVVQTTPAAVSGSGPGGVELTAIVGGGVHSLAGADAEATNCAGFVDMRADDPACPAVAVATQQGTIRGYAGVPPRFGPTDNVQRAQVAAFLVRALAWQNHPTGPRTYTDLAGLATELRTASLIAANTCDNNGLCVAYGYGDGRFGPTDNVSHAQVITFITRAFRLDPVQTWVPQPGDPQLYTGVPAVHDTDVRTFVHYAGGIPNAPSTAAGWNAPASRAWVAMLLYQALTVQP